MSTTPRTMTGGEAMVEVLKAEGVEYVFGLPGGHTLGFYDALARAEEITHILVRHEQVASNMAAAYAQLTGNVGVCCATAGPGATNLVTGIAEAYIGAQPVVAITGRGNTNTTHRGASQEIQQQLLFAPITKWAVRVDRADLLPSVMQRAFTIARAGKPGPVLVDVPRDLQSQMIEFGPYQALGKTPRVRADRALVVQVAERLLAAARPIVIAGGGAVAAEATPELVRLAELMALPVLTTLSGRGSFPDDHPLAAGGLGMHRNDISKKLLNEADFVLGLGCRFEEMESNWTPAYLPAAGACYVQVDVDATELGKAVMPTIAVVSDAKLLLEDLAEVLRQKLPSGAGADFAKQPRVLDLVARKRELEATVVRSAASDEVPVSPVRVMREIREVFGPDATGGVDIGMLTQGLGVFPYFKVRLPRSLIVCMSFYAMGYASSAIPVAKLVYPDRPAVAMCGDGTFFMIMNVLPVALEYRLGATWCVFNNHSYGSIKRIQELKYGGRSIGTSFGVEPDIPRLAEACGCRGERVEHPDEIRPALERAFAANQEGIPAVIDFWVADTWPDACTEYITSRPGK